MNQTENIQLKKMINENNVVDYTEDIRAKKHSSKIHDDVQRLLELKRKYSRIAVNNPEQFDEMCIQQCNFIFTIYTDIFNKVKKEEMNLEILSELLSVLKRIEEGEIDQHEGAFAVGKLLKTMYIDSALLKAEKIDKETGEKIIVVSVPAKQISWKEYKIIHMTPIV
jgi:hypothetical protein